MGQVRKPARSNQLDDKQRVKLLLGDLQLFIILRSSPGGNATSASGELWTQRLHRRRLQVHVKRQTELKHISSPSHSGLTGRAPHEIWLSETTTGEGDQPSLFLCHKEPLPGSSVPLELLCVGNRAWTLGLLSCTLAVNQNNVSRHGPWKSSPESENKNFL